MFPLLIYLSSAEVKGELISRISLEDEDEDEDREEDNEEDKEEVEEEEEEEEEEDESEAIISFFSLSLRKKSTTKPSK